MAVDGAANRLGPGDPVPGAVVGDFDSLESRTRKRLSGVPFVHDPGQEDCDLEKAVRYALGRGARAVTVLGASGGRVDHALTVYSVLVRYHGRADIRVVDGATEVRVVSDGAAEVDGAAGDTVSLVVFAPVPSVTLTGVQWPLRGERLEPGSRGVSNRMLGSRATLEVAGGAVVLVHISRRAP